MESYPITLYGTTIIVTSEENCFEQERDGFKRNVLTQFSKEDEESLIFKRPVLSTIIIKSPHNKDFFERKISDITKIDDTWVFSWM